MRFHAIFPWFVVTALASIGALAACGSSGGAAPTGVDAGDAAIDVAANDDSSSDASAADAGLDVQQQDPNVYPAKHHPLPQVGSQGGVVIAHPKLVTVTFDGDHNAATYIAFDQAIGSSMWWQKTLLPYGISPAVVSAAVSLPDTLAGMTLTFTQLEAYLGQQVASGALPPPDADTIYVVYASSTLRVTEGGSNVSCFAFDGFHDTFTATLPAGPDGGTSMDGGAMIEAPYAMVFNCGVGIQWPENAASHEIAEATTDPLIDHMASYYLESNPAWSQVFAGSAQAGEVADLCFYTDPWIEGSYAYNRIYSNAAAALSQNPCQPDTNVYFGAAIDTLTLGGPPSGGDGFLEVQHGASVSAAVHFFSQAALPMDATLTVGVPKGATQATFNGPLGSIATGVTATLSQSTAHNGDGLVLTLSADATTKPGRYPFVIRSTLSATNFNDWAAELIVQ